METANKRFTNPNLYCFDIDQYIESSCYLTCSVLVNHNQEILIVDVKVKTRKHFAWLNDRWLLVKDLDDIKHAGLKIILGNHKHY